MTTTPLPRNATVAVDLVTLTVRDGALQVLLVRRGIPPFKGGLALPGGFVRDREDLAAAAVRELREETGVESDVLHLEQLATYGDPTRDPRGRVISVAYLILGPQLPEPRAGSDAREALWWPVAAALDGGARLAFDHRRILTDGLERARAKLEYTPVATAFCGPEFTVAELRRVYEIVWGSELDAGNFHRKVTGTAGLLEPTGRQTARDGGRPAMLYRLGATALLQPPLLRPQPAAATEEDAAPARRSPARRSPAR